MWLETQYLLFYLFSPQCLLKCYMLYTVLLKYRLNCVCFKLRYIFYPEQLMNMRSTSCVVLFFCLRKEISNFSKQWIVYNFKSVLKVPAEIWQMPKVKFSWYLEFDVFNVTVCLCEKCHVSHLIYIPHSSELETKFRVFFVQSLWLFLLTVY